MGLTRLNIGILEISFFLGIIVYSVVVHSDDLQNLRKFEDTYTRRNDLPYFVFCIIGDYSPAAGVATFGFT